MKKLIPEEYFWLLGVSPKPKMLLEAIKTFGVKEGARALNNPEILQWATEVAVAGAGNWLDDFYTEDAIPWCGLYVGLLAARAGYTVRPRCLAARDWANWGEGVSKPGIGDVLVFWRGSRHGKSGHVGLYVGEDAEAFHVLGGNQGDEVSIVRISRDRFLDARRWPGLPAAQVNRLSVAGKLSENEA